MLNRIKARLRAWLLSDDAGGTGVLEVRLPCKSNKKHRAPAFERVQCRVVGTVGASLRVLLPTGETRIIQSYQAADPKKFAREFSAQGGRVYFGD